MAKTTRRKVEPVAPVAAYIGGKRRLAQRLVDRIERVPHSCYAEPFVGMGGVFFRRRTVAPAEVINDLNRDVATLFRILQRHYVAFIEMLRFQITTRAEFERLTTTDPDTLTDLERAARFLYLQRTTFGGKVSGRAFGVEFDRPARFDVTRLAGMLEDVHGRLARVVIECLPYAEFIERYDRKGTLFYIDPPYHGSEGEYGRELFTASDFERLAALLRGLKGRFILSINDTPEMRKTFAGFRTTKVETRYTVSAHTKPKRAGELIITGGAKRGRTPRLKRPSTTG